jgi:hypothetical protein
MSFPDELHLRHLLSEANFYIAHQDESESYFLQATEAINKCENIIKANLMDSLINLSPETLILFAETALNINPNLSLKYISYFLQRLQMPGQIYIRALLIQARLIGLGLPPLPQGGLREELLLAKRKAEENVGFLQTPEENKRKAEEGIENCNKALGYVMKVLEIVGRGENKNKYSFLIYNTSVCVYEIIRSFLKENWQRNFVEILEKIDKLFEEVDESDMNWRYRYTLLLFQALYDADKKPDAFKILERLVNAVKNKGGCDFEDQLLRLRIHLGKENSAIAAGAKKVESFFINYRLFF